MVRDNCPRSRQTLEADIVEQYQSPHLCEGRVRRVRGLSTERRSIRKLAWCLRESKCSVGSNGTVGCFARKLFERIGRPIWENIAAFREVEDDEGDAIRWDQTLCDCLVPELR